jgi:glucose-1-phosphate cytidylyltransferase
MKVAILCGGKGTRFQPVSEDIPKPMAPIGNMPILEHMMGIYSHFGHKDFVLLLGYKGDVIEDYFKGRHEDWNIEFKFTGEDSQTGERVFKARDLLDDTFFLTYGDGLADININEELKFHKGHEGIGTITMVPMPSPFGVLSLNGNKVRDFIEKPTLKEHWINGGFFIFETGIFDYSGRDLEKDILPKLASDGLLYAYEHTGFWKCMDHYKDYTQLNEMWNNGSAKWAMWENKK